MIDIKKRPNKTYITIYDQKTKKKVITLLHSKENLHIAKHVSKYWNKYFIMTIETGWINRSDWADEVLELSKDVLNTDYYWGLL